MNSPNITSFWESDSNLYVTRDLLDETDADEDVSEIPGPLVSRNDETCISLLCIERDIDTAMIDIPAKNMTAIAVLVAMEKNEGV